MTFKANELYSHYQLGSRYYLQVPDWLFLKGDSYLFAAKLFDMTKLEFFAHMRDTYDVNLVNYKSFIGFTANDEATIRKIVIEFNRRLRKKLRQAAANKGGQD